MLVSQKRRETLKNCFQTEQTDGGRRRIFGRSVALLPSKAGPAVQTFLNYLLLQLAIIFLLNLINQILQAVK